MPFSLRRKIFSRTTIALSTSIPIARAKPAIEITFRVRPPWSITKKVTMTDTGIDKATINELRTFRRKNNSTRKTIKKARRAVVLRLVSERVIKSAKSIRVDTSTPCPALARIPGKASLTARLVWTVLASACFCMKTIRADRSLLRMISRCSLNPSTTWATFFR